jgi:peptide deformylase
MDETGNIREVEATGFEAVAIQHEMDHLDGILFLDRIVSLKTGLFRRKNYQPEKSI